jgi:tetratricopeptide (TPR) repeat protein
VAHAQDAGRCTLAHRAVLDQGPDLTVALAEGYFLAGRTEEAVPLAERALALTRERGERGQEAWSLRLLGEIHSHPHVADVDQARGPYDEARDIAERLGMRPLVAHCHFGLGRLFCNTGDRVKGREHLATAARMYREMDMGFWLEKAEAELDPPIGTHAEPGQPSSQLNGRSSRAG